MTHVAATGAAGFIGSHLVDMLLLQGRDVVGIDCFTDYYDPQIKWSNLGAALGHPHFTLLDRNLIHLVDGDRELVEAFEHPSCVYRLAAQAGVRASRGNGFGTYTDNNVLATQAVLEASAAGGAASSSTPPRRPSAATLPTCHFARTVSADRSRRTR
jgi:nucleoside-diphosphate-sugar epimerase